MYALQKHSAKIAFFYLIKKPFEQIFQQFIVSARKISRSTNLPFLPNLPFYHPRKKGKKGKKGKKVKKIAKTLDKGVSVVIYLHRRKFNY